MRKALQNNLYILLLASLGLIATLAFLFATAAPACANTAECSAPLKTPALEQGNELLWESLSRQFVVSVIPE